MVGWSLVRTNYLVLLFMVEFTSGGENVRGGRNMLGRGAGGSRWT